MEKQNIEIKRISVLGIIFNLVLLCLKLVAGLMSKSQAMIADGLNSAGDIFASLMSYIGNKISSKPNDEDHPYGHGKAEYIFSQLIGVSMIVAAVVMIKNSFMSIVQKQKIEFSILLVVVCIITIFVKFMLYIYTKKINKVNKSILIQSSMEDHRNDVFVTIGTLIGIFTSYLGLYFIDGIVGIIISAWILNTGIKIFKFSYNVLMDTDITKFQKVEIEKLVEQFPEIMHVDTIITKPVGIKYIVIMKISMDGNWTLFASHDIAGKFKAKILDEFENVMDVIIHINPH